MVFIEIGLGWKWLAVAHILGNAMVRTMQFLRAPSMLHDYHQMHSAIGGEVSPTGKQIEELLPGATAPSGATVSGATVSGATVLA